MARILVVEDERVIAAGLQDELLAEGYEVEVVGDGLAAEERARAGAFDLILHDVMLPKKDGFAVCRSLRASGSRTPIIILTARVQDSDKILGLELGADDYVTKPFNPAELLARVRAVLRKARGEAEPAAVWEHGDLRVDFVRLDATRGGCALALTPTEFKILRFMIDHRGQAVTFDQLLAHVWGDGVFMSDRVIYTHINNLRQKIEDEPSRPRLVVSLRGVGYRFEG
jgi:DNA-binding response OmpR family regulator